MNANEPFLYVKLKGIEIVSRVFHQFASASSFGSIHVVFSHGNIFKRDMFLKKKVISKLFIIIIILLFKMMTLKITKKHKMINR